MALGNGVAGVVYGLTVAGGVTGVGVNVEGGVVYIGGVTGLVAKGDVLGGGAAYVDGGAAEGG